MREEGKLRNEGEDKYKEYDGTEVMGEWGGRKREGERRVITGYRVEERRKHKREWR